MDIKLAGWLTLKLKGEKRSHKYYFILRGELLLWFEKEPNSNDIDSAAKSSKTGRFELANSFYSLTHTDGHYCLNIFESHSDPVTGVPFLVLGAIEKREEGRGKGIGGINISVGGGDKDKDAKGKADKRGTGDKPSTLRRSDAHEKLTLDENQVILQNWLSAFESAKAPQVQSATRKLKRDETYSSISTQRSGYMEKTNAKKPTTGSKKYFCLNGSVLTWYQDQKESQKATPQIDGTMALEGAKVSHLPGAYSVTIESSIGKSLGLKALTTQEADEWTNAFKAAANIDKDSTHEMTLTEGWVIKRYIGQTKNHKRFIVLTNDYLKYYDTDHWGDATPKGDIYLGKSVVHISDGDTFVVCTFGREYPFESSDAKSWVKSINTAIIRANQRLDHSVLKHQPLKQNEKGAMKWVCLTKDFSLLVFQQATHPDLIAAMNADEAIEMPAVQKVELSPTLAKTIVVVPGAVVGAKEKKGAQLTLLCPDAESLQSWQSFLESAVRREVFVESKQQLVFGQPLASILAREGGAIPQIVVRCVEFLSVHGHVSGVLRLSGSASEIEKYQTRFDEGKDVDFARANVDVHVVAGLLKLFLREMPEPLLSIELLSLSKKPDIMVCLSKHEKSRYDFAKYLFHFLSELAKAENVTQMGAGNLSIVIGPNILRGDSTGIDMIPEVGRITQLFITRYEEIFESDTYIKKNKSRPMPNAPLHHGAPSDLPPSYLPPSDYPPSDYPPSDLPPSDFPPMDFPPSDLPPMDFPPSMPPSHFPPSMPPSDYPPTDLPPSDYPADLPPSDFPLNLPPPMDHPDAHPAPETLSNSRTKALPPKPQKSNSQPTSHFVAKEPSLSTSQPAPSIRSTAHHHHQPPYQHNGGANRNAMNFSGGLDLQQQLSQEAALQSPHNRPPSLPPSQFPPSLPSDLPPTGLPFLPPPQYVLPEPSHAPQSNLPSLPPNLSPRSPNIPIRQSAPVTSPRSLPFASHSPNTSSGSLSNSINTSSSRLLPPTQQYPQPNPQPFPDTPPRSTSSLGALAHQTLRTSQQIQKQRLSGEQQEPL